MFDVFAPRFHGFFKRPRLANSGDDIARAPTWKDTLKAAETGFPNAGGCNGIFIMAKLWLYRLFIYVHIFA